MAAIVGKNTKIYIQVEDQVIDISGFVISMSLYSEPDSNMHWTLEGLGKAEWVLSEILMSTARSAVEWMCGYCNRPNERKQETCAGCGAVRPFIYD